MILLKIDFVREKERGIYFYKEPDNNFFSINNHTFSTQVVERHYFPHLFQ